MKLAEIVRGARRAAALTQTELARRAGTAQSAVAAYESGARMPSLATLERLLGACDYDVELVARPRTSEPRRVQAISRSSPEAPDRAK